MRKVSLEGKLAVWLILLVTASAGCGALSCYLLGSPWVALGLSVLVSFVPVLLLARHLLLPVRHVLRALSGAVSRYRDGDFGVSLVVGRRDELGELLEMHNELGKALREQHQRLAQREMLLQTVMQNSPVALLLLDPGGYVVFANLAARHLLNDGRSLEGQDFTRLALQFPTALREAFDAGTDSLFTVEVAGTEESYHLAQRNFQLQRRPHRLFLLKRMTRELSRQEVAVWKKLIRVLSHELNNSLAPISSVAHTGAAMVKCGDYARLAEVFDRIDERAHHLQSFIDSYASLARLPAPRLQEVQWQEFAQGLAVNGAIRVQGQWPEVPGCFDPVQISQAVINLLKNALESGSPPEEVELRIEASAGAISITVSDRGTGMSDAVLASALLPFYSTKRGGTGLGLPLAREIVEAHGGNIMLSNRQGGGLCVRIVMPQTPCTQQQREQAEVL